MTNTQSSPLLQPRPATKSPSRQGDLPRALTSEVRLLLAELRDVFQASAAAVLVGKREDGLLQIRWCEPSKRRRPVVRLEPAQCPLARTIISQRPLLQRDLNCRDGDGCEICREVFGETLRFAAPIRCHGTCPGIVAVFAPPGDPPRRTVTRASRLAHHLGTLLSLEAATIRAEQRASRMATANRIGATLTSILAPEVLFPRILTETASVIPCDTAILYLFDPQEQRLRIAAVRGYSPDLRRSLDENADERIPGLTFRSRKPVLLRDAWQELRDDPASRQMTYRTRHRSSLGVPIVRGEEALGIISLNSSEVDVFSDEDCEMLTSIAGHAAVAITNARLHGQVSARLRSRLRDLANLSEIGHAIGDSLQTTTVLQNIVRGTAEAFRSAGSAIALLDEGGKELYIAASAGLDAGRSGKPIPLVGSASGWVVQRGETLFVPSVSDGAFEPLRSRFESEGIRSFIGVPLVVRGKAIGSLNVYSPLGQWFDTNDVELLQALASQAAIAIAHAHLYEAIVHEKAKLEAVVESLREGLLLVDSAGMVVYGSRRFVELLALEAPPPAGGPVEELWQQLAAHSLAPEDASSRLKALASGSTGAAVVSMGEPRRRELEVESFVVREPGGSLLGRGYLVSDITERAEIERLRASMLSTVSHELRTPLASIKGFATSLLRTDVEWDDASKRDFIERIDRETDCLGVLVRNLLDMSRIEAGTLRLDREWCDLCELVVDIMGRMAPLLAGHRADLVVGDSRILALVDRRYLERVIWNLVDNAVKYSPQGSTITAGVARESRDAVITVRDQGLGIRPEEKEQIFERFYRGSGVRSTGVGLGLAICRGIVEAHSGRITVDSKPGGGSLFTVRLPVQAKLARLARTPAFPA